MIAYKYLQLLISYLLCNNNFGQIADYCSTFSLSYQAYNIGRTVFIGEGIGKTIWNFDPQSLMMQKLDLETIFLKDTFTWVYTAFAFNFARCDKTNSSDYCAVTAKARTLAIAIGHRSNANESFDSGYITYSFKNGELSLMPASSELVWNLKTSSSVNSDFWIQNDKWFYSSIVFIPQSNQLLASAYKTKDSTKSHQLMSKKLKPNGEWNAWTNIGNIEFAGMFHIDGRTFGMNKNNVIHEIIVINNRYEFKKISSVKEFLNCYENSTLVIKDRIPPKPGESLTTDELNDQNVMTPKKDAITSEPLKDSKNKSKSILIIVIVIIVVIIAVSCCICLCLYIFVFRKMKPTVEYQTSDKFKHHRSRSGSNKSRSESKRTHVEARHQSQPVKPSNSTTKTEMYSKPFTKSNNQTNVAVKQNSFTTKSEPKSANSEKSLDKKASSKPQSRTQSTKAVKTNTVRSSLYH